jgi:hypothetical protein
MTIDASQLQELGALLDGVSQAQLRELGIAALREARRNYSAGGGFTRHGELGRCLIPLLAQTQSLSLRTSPHLLKELFVEADTDPALLPVAEFLDWFVCAGFAVALGAPVNRYPITYRLTALGIRLLDGDDDHPLLPGSVDQICARCPGLPAGVIALLSDAHACLERALLRPAVTVMGVAYETVVEHVVEVLITRAVLPADVADAGAAARIARVRRIVDTHLPGGTVPERDDRFAVHRALNFADDLRRRRNDAAHTRPRFGFTDRAEVEELLVSASRNLPVLWILQA